MERQNGTHVRWPLAGVIAGLVDRATDHVVTGVDEAEAVDDLVAASRWNPALLMAATKLADKCPDSRFEPAVENLRAAEQRVRQRIY